jgi:two-component system, OmpR family, heavy metal sensor histidine kinase CusS
MRRSFAATLALAFGATTFSVFALVGNYVYFALDRQVRLQDDLDVVLAARHLRRLVEELDSDQTVRQHADRLVSVVLGNSALSTVIFDEAGRPLVAHDGAQADDSPVVFGPGRVNAAAIDPSLLERPAKHVAAGDRITDEAIVQWRTQRGAMVRTIAFDSTLRDHEPVRVLISRDMRGPLRLLDDYRDTLKLAGIIGSLFALIGSYLLIRIVLRPLREIAAYAHHVTIDRLDSRVPVEHVPRELTALVTSLNGMLARLHGGFQKLSQFTADLAHDMRTPLANMRGATEVALARPRSNEEYQTLLASNLEECDRLSKMIENVIFLARAEHPQFVTSMREFDVREELDRIAGYFEGLAEEAGSVLRVTGGGRLRADLELFRRALGNLLANALRYTPRGRKIEIVATQIGDMLRIVVANEGAPIDAVHLERIFDRFYRVDPSRSSASDAALAGASAGLGLAIVSTVMELHGGTVSAQSDTKGTRLILMFPSRPARVGA